jgi:elongation factor G
MKKLIWNKNINFNNGESYETSKLNKSDEFYSKALAKRLELIEKLAQVNEEFAEILLEKYNLDYESFDDHLLLETYLRKSNLKCQITPVLCGSSFKNMAVQPIMDAIIKYLPSPLESLNNNQSMYYEDNVSAFCFKILHDHQKSRKKINSSTAVASLNTQANSGTILNKAKNNDDVNEDVLTFVRVYSGQLAAKSKLYNVNKKVKETCDKIYIPYANQLKQVTKLTNGNIGIVSGLTKVFV